MHLGLSELPDSVTEGAVGVATGARGDAVSLVSEAGLLELYRRGGSFKVVQARLGQASAKTTLDVYGHLFPDEENRTRGAIDAALGSPASGPRPEGVSRP